MKRILLSLALTTGLLLTATAGWAAKTTKMDTPLLSCSAATSAQVGVESDLTFTRRSS